MKKLLVIIMSVGLVIGLIGGAFAYFTDVETSTGNTLQAGTLDIQIGDNNEGYGNVPVTASFLSPSGWAPGQSFVTDPVYFKNVGSIPIKYIFGTLGNMKGEDGTTVDPEEAGINDIYSYIILEAYLEKAGNSTGTPVSGSGPDADGFYTEVFDEDNANAYLDFWGRPTDGSISLLDLLYANSAGSSTKTGLWFFDGGNDPTTPCLAVGSIAQLKFKFKLAENTPNNYQGDIASFSVDFTAAQTELDLDESITEPVGPDWAP